MMLTQYNQKTFRNILGAIAFIFALAVMASAQEAAARSAIANIGIENFGQMDERFYRGAQPKTKDDFKALADLGIRTVIDLRDDPMKYERPMVESLGMRYVHIPMVSKKYPTEEVVQTFLRVVNDPATGKFFVHCAGGRHRTGAMGAVYRYNFYHWSFDQVYTEMKIYDFYTRWGHENFKTFVEDYYARMQASGGANHAAIITPPLNTAPTRSEQRKR
ncbi:MAG: tyrosine-protein phosphatase [Pyrinomonadaceae bacterium]|nr:tyrosine-protein phosphatase [Pyrinomonadaceae bacterium]